MISRFLFSFLVFALIGPSTGRGKEFRLASPFTDHMVLQRETSLPVWGWSKPESEITVRFSGQEKRAKADRAGKWSIRLDPLPASAKGSTFSAQTGESRIELNDVVVGEVWICSGQSNMQMGRSAVSELKNLPETNLRTFEVRRTVAFTEQEELEGNWKVEGPSSAVGFAFAHFLAKQLEEVPVGIILAAWGSSSIEAWMPRDMTKQLPYFKTIMEEWDADKEAQARIQAALEAGKWSRDDDIFMRRQSNIVYNAMIKPLVPFACRGLVWYQGERNTRYISGMPEGPWYHRVAGIREYDETLIAWIERYREEWAREDMHFLLVMLPGFGQTLKTGPTMDSNHPASHSWAWMRESQMAALALPHVAVANTIDLGDAKNIHPKDKAPIGQRLALLAARQTSSRNIVASGPRMKSIEKSGNKLIVHFENATGLKTTDGAAPKEFWIADGENRKWIPAAAELKGETVVLHSPGLADPDHVRYAFTGKPSVNLVNGSNLPAYPFRSDSLEP